MKSIFKSVRRIGLLATLLASGFAAAQDSAVYELTFTNLWNSEEHRGFPSNAHFSPIITVNHKKGFELFKVGERVTDGFEQLAEIGNNSLLKAEINLEVEAGLVKGFTESKSFFPATKGESISFEVRVSRDHPYLSLATMIAPSPDWVVGFSGLPFYTNGTFIEAIDMNLYALNAGTEEGDLAGNFSIRNEATVPQEKLSPLWNKERFLKPFAKVSLKLKRKE